MFTKKSESMLEEAIEEVLSEMSRMNADTESYAKATKRLEELYALKNSKKRRVSPDTMAVVIGNLAGILLILEHERAHVIATKALNFAGKLK